MIIQILLLAGALLLLSFFVRQWDKVYTRAWKRIAFFAFLVANVYAVLRPDDLTKVAHKVGVGRGTDLVLYLLVVGVAFMTMNTFLRFRALERKLTDLARSVAIRDAQLLNSPARLERNAAASAAAAAAGEQDDHVQDATVGRGAGV